MKRSFLAAAFLALFSTTAFSAPDVVVTPRKYAVLSLIGDTVNVVVFQMSTGSLLDRNRHESFPVPDTVFDRAALLAAEESLKRIDAQSSVSLFSARSPDLFSEQWKLFDGLRIVLPDELNTTIKNAGATHLILMTKHRGEASLEAQSRKLGSGMLEGVGLYVDRQTRLRRSDTRQAAQGFLAPFVYVKISFVDLASSTVIRQQVITSTTTLSAARSNEGFDPWEVLTAPEKIDTLRRMVVLEVTRVVPLLVAAP